MRPYLPYRLRTSDLWRQPGRHCSAQLRDQILFVGATAVTIHPPKVRQSDLPCRGVACHSQLAPHPALISLTRLLAQQAVAEFLHRAQAHCAGVTP